MAVRLRGGRIPSNSQGGNLNEGGSIGKARPGWSKEARPAAIWSRSVGSWPDDEENPRYRHSGMTAGYQPRVLQ